MRFFLVLLAGIVEIFLINQIHASDDIDIDCESGSIIQSLKSVDKHEPTQKSIENFFSLTSASLESKNSPRSEAVKNYINSFEKIIRVASYELDEQKINDFMNNIRHVTLNNKFSDATIDSALASLLKKYFG